MKISVIIPCYNEEDSVAKVIKSIPKEVFEIIVVDNNSTDRTADIAKENGATVIKEKIQGYGKTIRRGFSKAQGDILVVLDGDGQYPAEKIMEVVEHLKKNNLDFISCNRFPLQDKKSLPFVRRFGNLVFNIITSILFFYKIKDSQSGMWVFRREVLEKISLESIDMPLSEEIKIKAIKHPYIKFEEYQIPYYERVGASKLIPLRHGIINLNYLFKLRLEMWKQMKINKTAFFSLGLGAVLLFFLFLAFKNINAPFTHVTADVNGQNGMAAINLVEHGFFKLEFGVYDKMLLNPNDARGGFYTHHPSFFVLPTALLYKFFGVSELTTRLGPLLYMLLGVWCFAFALRKIFKNDLIPLLIVFVFASLPGVIFYGETFELAVFSLPSALITFSFFVFYLFSEKKVHLVLFLLSIITGGLMGWFFYLMPVVIWFFILFSRSGKKLKNRKILLFIIPFFTAFAFALNLFHFYLLNGLNMSDLKSAFSFRASRQPFSFWWTRIYSMLKLHATWIFLLTTLAGLGVFIYEYKKKIDWRILSLFILFPVLVAGIFFQWSTHPFGVIFVLPAIAIFSGLFFWFLIDKLKWWGILIVLIIFSFGNFYAMKNLDYFFNDFVILKHEDADLLKALKGQVDHHEVCLGANDMGLGFRGIADWYLGKKVEISPTCLEDEGLVNQIKVVVIMHPGLGDYYLKEGQKFEDQGFKFVGCTGGYFCVLQKDSDTAILGDFNYAN